MLFANGLHVWRKRNFKLIFSLDRENQFIYTFPSITLSAPLKKCKLSAQGCFNKMHNGLYPIALNQKNLPMDLENLLNSHRPNIIKKWRDLILASYPESTQRFLVKEKSQFANPVGHIIERDIETLYDELVKGEGIDKISLCLDNILRIRAVQDFKPSHAISFVLGLKKVIREELEGKRVENGFWSQLQAFDTRVDEVALLAFDIFSKCRQKIYDIRVNEVKNQVGRLLERANLIVEIPENESGL